MSNCNWQLVTNVVDGFINDIMTKYFYSMRIYTIFYMLWKLSGYNPIGYDPKIAIESIESEL